MSARTLSLVAPYAVWMILMAVLPQTAWAYAVRGVVTAVFLAFSFARSAELRSILPRGPVAPKAWGLGCAVGLVVFGFWAGPELLFDYGTPVAAAESPYAPVVCGWPLTLAKLAASAFVIPIAEELFFRQWLVEFAGFWWMIALFAVEHGERWHVGALTGIAYGLLAKRFGLFAAIVAHAVTNLVLALLVILFDRWQFW